MSSKQTLYSSIRQIREDEVKPYYRVLLSGYFNDDEAKNMNTEKYLKETVAPYLQNRTITGYLYLKGLFYLHLIESKNVKQINDYLNDMYRRTLREPKVHREIRIVYQSYECPTCFFLGWECDYLAGPGPVLIDTDKTEEQIADRSYDIYESIEEGAKKKLSNAAHKISNMFLLSNDDMSILICKNFMSLAEYHEIYLANSDNAKECQSNYPLPPTIFNTMEFLETQDYTKYK